MQFIDRRHLSQVIVAIEENGFHLSTASLPENESQLSSRPKLGRVWQRSAQQITRMQVLRSAVTKDENDGAELSTASYSDHEASGHSRHSTRLIA